MRNLNWVGSRPATGDLRWVDDAGHAALAMGREGAVEPDRVGVIDCDSEYI